MSRDYKQEYKPRDRERKEPYAMDSTKGGSVINPLNYKGDVLVQVWVDSRVLATLCRWLDNQGVYTRFMSQVVRRPLEVMVDFLVESKEVELVDNTVEARVELTRRYGVDLNRGGRGTKNIDHNIILTVRREELSERVNREKLVDDASRPLRFGTRSKQVEDAVKVYRELEDNKIV